MLPAHTERVLETPARISKETVHQIKVAKDPEISYNVNTKLTISVPGIE